MGESIIWWVGLFAGATAGAVFGVVLYHFKGELMATADEIRSKLAELKTGVSGLSAAIELEKAEITEALKRLSDLVAAGNVPTDIADTIAEVSSSVVASVAKVAELVPTPDPLEPIAPAEPVLPVEPPVVLPSEPAPEPEFSGSLQFENAKEPKPGESAQFDNSTEFEIAKNTAQKFDGATDGVRKGKFRR